MKRHVLRTSIALAVVAACVGCVSTGSGGSRGTGNVLTYENLIETGENDLYMIIERLRPRWLRPRGQTSFTATTVVTLFVDGSPRGDVSQMRGMIVTDILDVTYLSASDAAFRFGTLAGSGGTISIRTGRRFWAPTRGTHVGRGKHIDELSAAVRSSTHQEA